jgi:hypothetical protein
MACWAFRLVVLEYVSQLEHPIIPCLVFAFHCGMWVRISSIVWMSLFPLKLDRSEGADHIFQH